MILVFITCQRKALMPLVDVMSDWKMEGAEIVLYGYTGKAQDGFLLMRWNHTPSEGFQHKQLKADPDILDYLIYQDSSHETVEHA